MKQTLCNASVWRKSDCQILGNAHLIIFGGMQKALTHKCINNSTFTRPHIVPNLYEFISPVEHKKRRMLVTKQLLITIDTMKVNGYQTWSNFLIFFFTKFEVM